MASTPDRVVLADGLTGRIASEGDAAIFWIHGYTLDSTSWGGLWRRLPEWRHVGVDLPGHGGSQALGGDGSLTSLARELTACAQAHGAAALIGLSFGAIVALQIAIEFPETFDAIVLGAPTWVGGPRDPRVERLYERLYEMRRAGAGAGPLAEAWTESPSPLFSWAQRHPSLWPQLKDVIDRHRWTELDGEKMRLLFSRPQRLRQLRAIRSRILVLVGDQDMRAFLRSAEMIRRAVPTCTRKYLPGAGHLCMLESPDLAARLISNHLAT